MADIIDLGSRRPPTPSPPGTGIITRRIKTARFLAIQAFKAPPLPERDQSFQKFMELQREFLRQTATGKFDNLLT
jgi:hypothetical protein